MLYCLQKTAATCRQYSTFAAWSGKSAVPSAENCRNPPLIRSWVPPLDPAPEVHGIIRTLIIKWREKSRRPRSGNDDPATERSDDTAGDPELRHGPLRSWVPPLILLRKCTE